MSDIADRIKSLRGKATRDEFSVRTGISLRSLVNYEKGERVPNAEAISKLCAQTGVSADWLLFGQEMPSEKEKPPTSEVLESKKQQLSENTTSLKSKTSDVGGFAQKLDQIMTMLQQAQTRMYSLLDDNAALRGELAALREERAGLRAEVKYLETELQRYKNGDLLSFDAPGALAHKPRPGSDEGDNDNASPTLNGPDINGLPGKRVSEGAAPAKK